MTLGELLSELRENILHDRSNRVAGGQDYLWSDETLVRYINEAQRRLAREALVIRDHVSDRATRVEIIPNVAEYPLDPSVFVVLSAQLDGDQRNMVRAGNHYLMGPVQAPYIEPETLLSLQPGKPRFYSTDEGFLEGDTTATGALSMRVYPVPEAASEIRLRVIRMPFCDFTVDNLDAEAEVPREHQIEMLDWAAYLALRIADVDAGLPQRAKEFRASFEDVIVRARRQVMRKLSVPPAYRFGLNGYTWGGKMGD